MSKQTTLDSNQMAAAAKLFSASVFHELATLGASPMFARLVSESSLGATIDQSKQVGELFDYAFSFLKRKAYRYEYAYRAAITHKVLLGVHSLKSASMLTEFRAGTCKADIVILNGTSTVYEIKSERDNLDRLDRQLEAYRKVFASVNIITSESHLSSVLDRAPDDVGVLVLGDRFQISTVRDAVDRPESIDPLSVLDSLQRVEALRILKLLGRPLPEVPNTKIHAALREQFKEIGPVDVHRCMLQVLKHSRSLLPLSDLSSKLPASLRPAVLSTNIRPKDHANLLSAIRTPISDALHWA